MSNKHKVSIPEDTFAVKSHSVERLVSPPAPVRIDQADTSTKDTEKLEKMSIYVTAAQKAKLDELAKGHRKHTGESTTRIDVVRMLIDQASIDTLIS